MSEEVRSEVPCQENLHHFQSQVVKGNQTTKGFLKTITRSSEMLILYCSKCGKLVRAVPINVSAEDKE